MHATARTEAIRSLIITLIYFHFAAKAIEAIHVYVANYHAISIFYSYLIELEFEVTSRNYVGSFII